MTLRPPHDKSKRAHSNQTASLAALDCEIAQERASALGRLGRALEAALAALSNHDSGHAAASSSAAIAMRDKPTEARTTEESGHRALRARLVQQASEALWRFCVQREACGLRDPRPVLRDYRVPAEVYARMGAFGGR
jgi:Family of unknown function (DUF6665)